jgi:hypothetical protein
MENLIDFEGSKSNIIANIVKNILQISDEKLKEMCAAIEKLTEAAYKEGKEDGQWS